MNREVICFDAVAPVRERGLKYRNQTAYAMCRNRRSREGAWIEILYASDIFLSLASRSREGAWIEIIVHPDHYPMTLTVAPVRERGLKYQDTSKRSPHGSRSREGAWIEIAVS